MAAKNAAAAKAAAVQEEQVSNRMAREAQDAATNARVAQSFADHNLVRSCGLPWRWVGRASGVAGHLVHNAAFDVFDAKITEASMKFHSS